MGQRRGPEQLIGVEEHYQGGVRPRIEPLGRSVEPA